MVRVSTTGMFDFSRFDPWDMWAWKKLRWVLDELELQHSIEINKVKHTHWVTLASHSNLTPESFDNAKAGAGSALNNLLKATYPWLADQIGEAGAQTEREEAVEAYHREFGRPGDPQYEAMIDTIDRALSKGKMTQLDKERDRARRRAMRAQQREQQGAEVAATESDGS